MYSDEDLAAAVKAGVLRESDVSDFRDFMHSTYQGVADEERFKLLNSFNDIFVVLACGLVLFPLLWLFEDINLSLAYAIFAGGSWLLAEFFVRKKKMALPGIALMISFAGGIFALVQTLTVADNETSAGLAFLAVVLAAYCHWRRFKVPITVAAITAAIVGVLASIVLQLFPNVETVFLAVVFISGVIVFAFAMSWDKQDTQRVSYKTDVAFWLHVLAAPLIVHPVFSGLDADGGQQSIVIILLYLVLTLVSIVIDRRVFMVSALGYVVYALSLLLTQYGTIGNQLGWTAVIVGLSLLLMSAYWQKIRIKCVSLLPKRVRQYLPVTVE